MEWKLFEGDVPHVSTFAFHEHRERAPHLEQGVHRPRLDKAYELVIRAVETFTRPAVKVVDLGCGDGGLLSLLYAHPRSITARGYDFQPSNVAGWRERHVTAYALNFVDEWRTVELADVYVATEVLEHLADPHRMLRHIWARSAQLVCSSPWTEHAGSHDECHAWAWDFDGYEQMIKNAGFTIVEHDKVDMFQVVWAV